jgi:hypothetical protein
VYYSVFDVTETEILLLDGLSVSIKNFIFTKIYWRYKTPYKIVTKKNRLLLVSIAKKKTKSLDTFQTNITSSIITFLLLSSQIKKNYKDKWSNVNEIKKVF